MDFELIVPKVFEDIPERQYINPCCIGGDVVLIQFKPEIASKMQIDEDLIDVYQEDWGWALEFEKEKVFYLLALNNNSEDKSNKSIFSAYTQATCKEKGLFIDKTVDALDENETFFALISDLAKKNGFEFYQNEI